MGQITRKQRQQELREIEKKQEKLEAATSIEKTDELIFKEQKQRLRKQLNDVPAIAIDVNETSVHPNRLQTRTEIKKQKKIDDILKDIAVVPEDTYLNEDTNLRILRNLSMHKKYDNLRLSPEQEEKMQENKDRFDSITSQLWFLIQELESKNVKDPELGRVPTVESKNKKKFQKERNFFDVEDFDEIEAEKADQTDASNNQSAHNESNKHFSDHIEEKLENFKLEEESMDGELTTVLRELDQLLQDDKEIVHNELKQREEVNHIQPPQDTQELLNILQELENEKQGTPEIDLTKAQTKESIDLLNKSAAHNVDSIDEHAEKEQRKTIDNTLIDEGDASSKQQSQLKKEVPRQSYQVPKPAKEKPRATGNVTLPDAIQVDPTQQKESTITEHHKIIDLTQPAIDLNEITAANKKLESTSANALKAEPIIRPADKPGAMSTGTNATPYKKKDKDTPLPDSFDFTGENDFRHIRQEAERKIREQEEFDRKAKMEHEAEQRRLQQEHASEEIDAQPLKSRSQRAGGKLEESRQQELLKKMGQEEEQSEVKTPKILIITLIIFIVLLVVLAAVIAYNKLTTGRFFMSLETIEGMKIWLNNTLLQ